MRSRGRAPRARGRVPTACRLRRRAILYCAEAKAGDVAGADAGVGEIDAMRAVLDKRYPALIGERAQGREIGCTLPVQVHDNDRTGARSHEPRGLLRGECE